MTSSVPALVTLRVASVSRTLTVGMAGLVVLSQVGEAFSGSHLGRGCKPALACRRILGARRGGLLTQDTFEDIANGGIDG